MKTRILSLVLPKVAFMCAIVAAFAFKPAPKSVDTLFFGAKQINEHACSITSIECSDVNNGIPCTDGSVNLYRMLSATSCPSQLWKP